MPAMKGLNNAGEGIFRDVGEFQIWLDGKGCDIRSWNESVDH